MRLRAEFPSSPTSPPRLNKPNLLLHTYTYLFMLNRLSLLTRHFPRPFNPSRPTVPAYSTPSLAPRTGSFAMTSAMKPIHTAACLIIGDEVLGGKVN
jgi:hypothetical protein